MTALRFQTELGFPSGQKNGGVYIRGDFESINEIQMKGPEGEKFDKRKETDPTEVASYKKPRRLRLKQFNSPAIPRGSHLI